VYKGQSARNAPARCFERRNEFITGKRSVVVVLGVNRSDISCMNVQVLCWNREVT